MNHNRHILYLSGFLFSVPIALASYINSSFVASFVGEKLIGLVYVLCSLSAILSLIIAPKIWRLMGGHRFLVWVALLDALSFFALAWVNSPIGIVVIFVFGFSLNTLVVFSLDELLKITSKNSSTGSIRGLYIAFSNAAWILAQLASGTILGEYSFRAIYFVGSLLMLIFTIISLLNLKHLSEPLYRKVNPARFIKEFFRRHNLVRAYGMTLLLQFFYSWMVIYTPIYLSSHIGFLWKEIGLIFAVMLLPFSLVPFSLGRYADKIGERRLLMLGFGIASLATLPLAFIIEKNILLWMFCLFLTRVGAATIEVMSDAYFFKHIKPEEDEFVGIYRSASPVAYIVGPLVASGLFLILPSFNFIFLALSIVLLSGIYVAATIKKNDI